MYYVYVFYANLSPQHNDFGQLLILCTIFVLSFSVTPLTCNEQIPCSNAPPPPPPPLPLLLLLFVFLLFPSP